MKIMIVCLPTSCEFEPPWACDTAQCSRCAGELWVTPMPWEMVFAGERVYVCSNCVTESERAKATGL